MLCVHVWWVELPCTAAGRAGARPSGGGGGGLLLGLPHVFGCDRLGACSWVLNMRGSWGEQEVVCGLLHQGMFDCGSAGDASSIPGKVLEASRGHTPVCLGLQVLLATVSIARPHAAGLWGFPVAAGTTVQKRLGGLLCGAIPPLVALSLAHHTAGRCIPRQDGVNGCTHCENPCGTGNTAAGQCSCWLHGEWVKRVVTHTGCAHWSPQQCAHTDPAVVLVRQELQPRMQLMVQGVVAPVPR
jgi:hypothetical protein